MDLLPPYKPSGFFTWALSLSETQRAKLFKRGIIITSAGAGSLCSAIFATLTNPWGALTFLWIFALGMILTSLYYLARGWFLPALAVRLDRNDRQLYELTVSAQTATAREQLYIILDSRLEGPSSAKPGSIHLEVSRLDSPAVYHVSMPLGGAGWAWNNNVTPEVCFPAVRYTIAPDGQCVPSFGDRMIVVASENTLNLPAWAEPVGDQLATLMFSHQLRDL